MTRGPNALREVPAVPKALPSSKGAVTGLQRRGLGPKVTPRQSRPPQVITPMGGTLRRGEGA
jgi:hypothetical protein